MSGRPSSAGARLLAELHQALTRYVVLPSPEAADAVALWIAATHAVPSWEHAARLVIKSPEKRCGKSRLLDVLEATCHKPLITVSISPAALVRSVTDEDPPTLLLDEADTVFGAKVKDSHEDLRGIINSGHGRNRPYVRWDVNTRRLENCPTFAMAALAGIGSMPDTIEDRAVVITMRRRAPGETVAPFRTRRDGPALESLRGHLHQWIVSRADELGNAEPVMPVEDRAADTWESLVAIADAAGGDWPARARKAALTLCSASTEITLGGRLLADLRELFDGDAMHGETILEALRKIDEAPWADYYGRPVNARDVAKLLSPYGVRSVDVKIGGINKKGYRRDHLHDPWSRYLDPPGPSAISATGATGQVSDGAEVAGSASQALPATGMVPLTSGVAEVAEVAPTPRCHGCGEPMTVAVPGQRVHPTCASDEDPLT
jgi:hypothetical protein